MRLRALVLIALGSEASAESLSPGHKHICGLVANGEVVCWGDNAYGQATPPKGSFTDLGSGDRHSCGLRNDGEVVCWGYDKSRDGRTNPPKGPFKALATGDRHTCGLRTSGEVACWGLNEEGTLPKGEFTSIAAGFRTTCGVRPSGEAECWGWVITGQNQGPKGPWKAISVGWHHVCGIRTSGETRCWGDLQPGDERPTHVDGELVDWYLQMGGNRAATLFPDGKFEAIASGSNHNCGLRASGDVECWGQNTWGEAGVHAGPYQSIAAGGSFGGGMSCGVLGDDVKDEHGHVVRAKGKVECWGELPVPDVTFKTTGTGKDEL